MEKKTWNEDDGGRWDYSNKQKQKIRAEQKKVEAKEMKKKNAKQKIMAAEVVTTTTINESTEETEFVEITLNQNEPNKNPKKTWWWLW